MSTETRKCQNCQQEFQIDEADFRFYQKINMPPPTFCHECRRQRRSSWRNERTLYRRKCNAPGHDEEIISIVSPDKPFIVYDDRFWWSDQWNPMEYGGEYDFSKPFFSQFLELLERVPLISLSVTNMVNCNYCNVSADDKECYLISSSDGNERVMYSNRTVFNKDSQDIYIGNHCELCYEIINCRQCYKLLFGFNCNQCTDSAFLYNCANCSNCFGCTNLRNKSYHIFNRPYSKDEYEKKMKKFDLGSFSALGTLKEKHKSIMLESIHRFAHILKSVNVAGDNVQYAKNCAFCFDVIGNPSAEDCKFVVWGGYNLKDSYDCGPGIGLNTELLYDSFDSGMQGSKLFFTSVVYGSHDVRYSINCHSSNNLFGCYGLRSKSYCILNKQYSKEEYEKLVPRIIEHMNTMPYITEVGSGKSEVGNGKSEVRKIVYKYGEFFPPELSPFSYNETIAQEYFTLSEAEAKSNGFRWQPPQERNYEITLKTEDIPDHIKNVGDSILKDIIQCAHYHKDQNETTPTIYGSSTSINSTAPISNFQPPTSTCNEQCTTAFRIIPQELEFYKKMNLPLPRLCPNCRHYQRIKQRNPLKLWHRKCMCEGRESRRRNQEAGATYTNTATHRHGQNHCTEEFETSYAPERPEIVYCEGCYQAEVV